MLYIHKRRLKIKQVLSDEDQSEDEEDNDVNQVYGVTTAINLSYNIETEFISDIRKILSSR